MEEWLFPVTEGNSHASKSEYSLPTGEEWDVHDKSGEDEAFNYKTSQPTWLSQVSNKVGEVSISKCA